MNSANPPSRTARIDRPTRLRTFPCGFDPWFTLGPLEAEARRISTTQQQSRLRCVPGRRCQIAFPCVPACSGAYSSMPGASCFLTSLVILPLRVPFLVFVRPSGTVLLVLVVGSAGGAGPSSRQARGQRRTPRSGGGRNSACESPAAGLCNGPGGRSGVNERSQDPAPPPPREGDCRGSCRGLTESNRFAAGRSAWRFGLSRRRR